MILEAGGAYPGKNKAGCCTKRDRAMGIPQINGSLTTAQMNGRKYALLPPNGSEKGENRALDRGGRRAAIHRSQSTPRQDSALQSSDLTRCPGWIRSFNPPISSDASWGPSPPPKRSEGESGPIHDLSAISAAITQKNSWVQGATHKLSGSQNRPKSPLGGWDGIRGAGG